MLVWVIGKWLFSVYLNLFCVLVVLVSECYCYWIVCVGGMCLVCIVDSVGSVLLVIGRMWKYFVWWLILIWCCCK